MYLSNKTILLTGASSGIGYELAKQLAAENCNLILLARRIELLNSLANQLKGGTNFILTFQCDIRDKHQVQKVFNELRGKDININIAILNSGVGNKSSVKNLNSDYADEIFQVNVLGMIYCVEELLKDFLPRKSGMIVGVSSIADVRGFPTNGFYCASKAAASTFLESIRGELKSHNVKVINVRPGFVSTSMVLKNKFKMPFLISAEKAAYIIISGIKKEKQIIQFPLGTVLGAKLIKLLPNFIFDSIFSNRLRIEK